MPQRSAPLATLLILLAIGLPSQREAGGEEPARLTPTADNTPITGATRLAAGAYALPDADENGVLQITEDGTVLDLRGAALIGSKEGTAPNRYRGVGIRVHGAKNVRIRGGVIRGYKIAVQAVDAPGLILENIDASENFRQRLGSTPEREDRGDWLWPHTNDAGEWEAQYGAGFSLTGCDRAVVRRCRVRDGQNGLLLSRCNRSQAYDNDFSFNSGWGIALWRSSHCVISSNHCDYCVRGYSFGKYEQGQDSAGILVFEQSSHNLIVGNSATHSGDGLFLYAGHETTKKTGKGGCAGNIVHDNDFSHAVANGIEATFSLDNVFVRNRCDNCRYGIWAGYSSRTLIGGNRMHGCTVAGIAIEHGHANRIVHNTITEGRVGVHLWWDHDPAFVDGVFGAERDTSSSKNLILGNDITGGQVAVQLTSDAGTELRWNVLHGYQALFELGADTRLGAVQQNLFRGVRSPARPPPLLARGKGVAAWALPTQNQRRSRLRAPTGWDLSVLDEALTLVRPPPRLPERPKVPGAGIKRLPDSPLQQRRRIYLGPWGPLDAALPGVYPRVSHANVAKTASQLLGQGTFRVRSVTGAVDVTPRQGKLPQRLIIAAAHDGSATGLDLRPFEVVLDVAGRREVVRGQVLSAAWSVAWFPWSADPRTDEAAWQKQVEKTLRAMREEGKREIVPAIDFRWRGGGPKGLEADRFGTVATTTLRLPAGRYRLRTVSDDGVRLYVDGKRVIDRWTHHAPTEDVAEVELTGGSHRFRLEHFELDGHAQLGFTLEKIP